MMDDTLISRQDERNRITDVRLTEGREGGIIITTTDPDGDVTAVVITKDEGIAIMEWLSRATR